MTTIDATTRLVEALAARVKITGAGRDRWRAQCPAHGGDDLNLAVAKGDQGVLVKCWSHDCSEGAIAEAVGLQLRDLFDRDGRAIYDYGGGYVIQRIRIAAEHGNAKEVRPIRAGITPTVRPMWQPEGSAPIVSSQVVMLCEGEKTADALVRLGAPCVATWAGGTNGVDKTDYSALQGRTVVIVPDNDEPGQKASATLQRMLRPLAIAVRVWRVPTHLNDAADLWLEGGTLDDLTTEPAIATPGPYVDVDAILNGTLEPRQTAAGGRRADGLPLLYSGAVNVLLGAPEAGKTLVAGAMTADELNAGGRALWIDLDHNGAHAILTRLLQYGVPRAVLVDATRFRLAIPDDPDTILELVTDAATWTPTLAVVDSIGELLPMFGANSNDADDYTRINRLVLTALAGTGAAVLAIDHEAKSTESRNYGATGSAAKKRAVDGALIRVTNVAPFTPGHGGEAQLTIVKDRHGALRAAAVGSREPTIARFVLAPQVDELLATFTVPAAPSVFDGPLDDVEQLAQLVPPPVSVKDVKERMKWGGTRATNALRELRERSGNAPGAPVPLFPTPIGGTGTGSGTKNDTDQEQNEERT